MMRRRRPVLYRVRHTMTVDGRVHHFGTGGERSASSMRAFRRRFGRVAAFRSDMEIQGSDPAALTLWAPGEEIRYEITGRPL